ncbi:unnamed protein product [Echinostoma caproni]|uniref:Transposase n=1 Tax=Echinostoma caproni TaxID=27848 RepID=A0A183A3U3_9TREM|nr:unnamed protein product [Echinostoma caproni]
MRLDKRAVQDRLSPSGTQWHFNPPCNSHRGGVWERLIRSVPKILTALCQQQAPDDETLSTFLVEAERRLGTAYTVGAKNIDGVM